MPLSYVIPASVHRGLQVAPADRPVCMLLRHSVRDPIPQGELGNHLPLTDDGVRIAQELGVLLGPRLRSLRTSPVRRCIETAEMLRISSGCAAAITTDGLLGAPSVFVKDPVTAWKTFQKLGLHKLLSLIADEPAPPGFEDPKHAVTTLVSHVLAQATDPGFHVFVTHDLLITITAAVLLDRSYLASNWPWFLEGAFLWRDDRQLRFVYRDSDKSLPWPPANHPSLG